jgi:hypothetical protein
VEAHPRSNKRRKDEAPWTKMALTAPETQLQM